MAGQAPEASEIRAGDDRRLRKDFGTIGLLFTAVGSIIGSGWLFGALEASQLAGPAAILSWALGAVMFIFIGMSYSELGTMFPHSGGVARFPHYSFGSFTSFSMGWVTWIAAAAVAPIEVLAVVQYATNYLPWLEKVVDGQPTLTGAGTGISIALMAVFVLVNFFGVRWFARINNILVWWKLAIIVLVIIVFFVVAFDGSHFSAHKFGGFAPYGSSGVFSAVATAGIAFSFFGFRQGVELAGETDNPKRNVPLTLIGSVVLTGVIYILLQVAFIGSVPSHAITAHGWKAVGENFTSHGDVLATFGPLAAIAGIIGVVWLAGLLYADAIISPGDTGLIYTGVTARISYAMGRNKNAPEGLSKVSDRGVPWVSLILAFIVGCLFFLPFPGWSKLVGFVTNSTVLSFGSGPLVLLALRKQLPHYARPFSLGKWVWPVAFLALWSTNLIVYWTGWDTNWKLFVIILVGYVLMALFQATAKDKSRLPKLDFEHGWWVLVWFAGLALISFLGDYPSDGSSTNLGVLGLNLGAVCCFVLTGLVMWLALRNPLPTHRVEEILAESGGDEGGETPLAKDA